jgi:hypothetical protein
MELLPVFFVFVGNLMKVKQLINELQKCNPEADCVISVDIAYSEYTTGEDQKDVTGIVTWPTRNKREATMVEITRKS